MTNQLSPEHMSPDDRIAEACKYFASAILRLRDATNHPTANLELDNPSVQSGLGDHSESGGQ